MPKWIIFMVFAILANSCLALFWKKAVMVTAPSLYSIVVGLTIFLSGVVDYLIEGGSWKTNNVGNFYPLILCAVICPIFYLLYSRALVSQEVSRAYPLNALGTIVVVVSVGVIFMHESLSVRKGLGMGLGIVAMWLLLF